MKNSSSMHIGVLSYDFRPAIGGLGILAETYVHELRSRNVNVTVISPASDADERGGWPGFLRWRKAGGCPMFSLWMNFRLPALLKRHGIDVLHVHAGSGGVFLLRKPPCKVVVTSHHTYAQEAALVYEGSVFRRLWKSFMGRLEAKTYRLADTVCCVSRDTRDELQSRYGIEAEKLCVVENPIPSDMLRRFRGLQKLKNSILFVGRIEERKGAMLLLEAFAELSKEMPDVRLRLVGKNLLGRSFHKYISESGIAEKVTLLGFVHDPFRFREMAQATVLVVPSKLEGFGLVAAEGMMLGTCVVASNAPGLRSIVADGKTGYLFSSGVKDDLVRVLKKALSDSSEREAIEKSGMLEAETRFSVQQRAGDLLSVLESVALEKRTK